MFAPDYRCNVRVNCTTCDVVGQLDDVGTIAVTRLMRTHKDCDVTYDFLNVKYKRPAIRTS